MRKPLPLQHTLSNTCWVQQPLLSLFSSIRAPGDAILITYDLARALRDSGVAVVGGFHSPMEQECLRLLLRGTQPVVVCVINLRHARRTDNG
ncbi:MAG: hypothetical protein HY342_04475 [Candidatus Lambdaproteobacteria bacterium]|nr:hypothetical protein [Candidatus Lambdaproteobacteria bacterium]